MDNKKALGQRIKELRKRRRMSQEKLAELIQVEPPSVSNIENGKNYPTMQNLEKIKQVLDVSFNDIFNFEHCRKEQDLKQEINKIMDNNPEMIRDIYKIVKAVTG